MSVTLYSSPRSPSTRVQWALEEVGVPYARVHVDLAANAHRSPAFLRINPHGKVPALVVDGVPVFESVAMLILISAAVAQEARAELDAQLSVLEGHLKGRQYMLGDAFTLVDVAVASMLVVTDRYGVDPDSDPRTKVWLARCRARPAMVATLAAG